MTKLFIVLILIPFAILTTSLNSQNLNTQDSKQEVEFGNIATEYDGGQTGIEDSVVIVREWTEARPEIFTLPEPDSSCCEDMGDVNDNQVRNILDITYLIAYIYKDGPSPTCFAQADTNCDCVLNILDVLRLIQHMWEHWWGFLCTCEEWEENCGDTLQ